MKKMKSILLTSLMAVVLCFCFLLTGCSAAGTYELDYVEIAGVKYEVGDSFMGATLEAEEVTLNKDGTVEGVYQGEEIPEGTPWTEDGDVVTIKYEDFEIGKYTKDGRKLIVEQNMGIATMKIVYKK